MKPPRPVTNLAWIITLAVHWNCGEKAEVIVVKPPSMSLLTQANWVPGFQAGWTFCPWRTSYATWAAAWENQRFAYADQLCGERLSFRYIDSTIHLLPKPIISRLHSPICVGPGQNPHCWFSHAGAHFISSCWHTPFSPLRKMYSH